MTTQTINEIWNYYLTLEGDITNTSRFIEPSGQENVHSFEFAKILILACTELESVFKLLCLEITGKQPEGTIGKYKETILGRYPRIVDAVVSVKRWGRTIAPFQGWDIGKLSWWNAYQEVKHNRGEYFSGASYNNAVYALSALYISILYLARAANIDFADYTSNYIESDYSKTRLIFGATKKLPDFETITT